LIDQICKFQQQFSTLRSRRIKTPSRLHRFFGSGNGEIDIGSSAFRYFSNNLTGGYGESLTLSTMKNGGMLARIDDTIVQNKGKTLTRRGSGGK